MTLTGVHKKYFKKYQNKHNTTTIIPTFEQILHHSTVEEIQNVCIYSVNKLLNSTCVTMVTDIIRCKKQSSFEKNNSTRMIFWLHCKCHELRINNMINIHVYSWITQDSRGINNTTKHNFPKYSFLSLISQYCRL